MFINRKSDVSLITIKYKQIFKDYQSKKTEEWGARPTRPAGSPGELARHPEPLPSHLGLTENTRIGGEEVRL